MKFLTLTSLSAILSSLASAANVIGRPMGNAPGHTWDHHLITGALGTLLVQAAQVPSSDHMDGRAVYRMAHKGGFSAALMVKESVHGIAADACELATIAYNALTPHFQSVVTVTGDKSAEFAVWVAGDKAPGGAKRDEFDFLAAFEVPAELEARAEVDDSTLTVLSKRNNGPFHTPNCKK